MSHQYTLRYQVVAVSEFDAIQKAVSLLRSAVRLIAVAGAELKGGDLWEVRLKVAEDA